MVQGYEFSGSQNELIGDLSKKMNFVGILMIAAAVLSLITGILALVAAFAEGTFDISSILQGILLLRSDHDWDRHRKFNGGAGRTAQALHFAVLVNGDCPDFPRYCCASRDYFGHHQLVGG
jgi:hypothetical protein